MKRVRIGVWAVVCTMILSISVVGATSNPSLGSRWQEIAAVYELKTTDVVPAGVTPLEIESPQALERLLKKLDRVAKKTTLTQSMVQVPSPVDVVESDGFTMSLESTYTIQVFHLHYDRLVDYIWRTRLNLYCTLYVGYSGSFHWIDDVRALRVSLSGLHPFSRLVNTWTDSYIHPNQQMAIIEGGGTLELFFILEGVFTYYSRPEAICEIYRL